MQWHDDYERHRSRSHRLADELGEMDDHMARFGTALVGAVLAVAAVNAGIVLELERIADVLEKQQQLNNTPVRLNLSGRLVPKQGGSPVAGPFNPSETEDVELAIAPVNAAGQPVSGPFVWAASSNAEALTVAADTKSAKFVTPLGSLDVVVSVTYPPTGLGEVAAIQRTVTPPDNTPVSLNLSGSVVPKA